MYRAWLAPLWIVPKSVRLSGALPMAFYAAINPVSWVTSPYLGVITFAVTLWFIWNVNFWGLIRAEDEDWDEYKWWWVLRASLYTFFLNWIPLLVVYLAILLSIKVSVMSLHL